MGEPIRERCYGIGIEMWESRVIEGWSIGKEEKLNNDRIIITKRYVAVVDGVSSRNIVEGTKTLSDKIVEIFEKNLRTGKDFEEVLDETNKGARDFKIKNNLTMCNKDGFVCGVLD